MNDEKQSVLLVLNTSQGDIKDNYNTNTTWKNINLRDLLGNLYNEYDYFNLQLVEICCGNDAVTGPPGSFNMLNLYLSGLPVLQYQKNIISNNICIASFANLINKNYIVLDHTNIITFQKKSIVDINIYYTLVNGLSNSPLQTNLYVAGWSLYNQCFIFKITGCDITENINMQKRIF
jgi:hypothetical protein